MTQEQFNAELLRLSEMYWDGLITKSDLANSIYMLAMSLQ